MRLTFCTYGAIFLSFQISNMKGDLITGLFLGMTVNVYDLSIYNLFNFGLLSNIINLAFKVFWMGGGCHSMDERVIDHY